MSRKIKFIGYFLNGATILASLISVSALLMIFFFVFSNGIERLSFNLLISDYHATHYVATIDERYEHYEEPLLEGNYHFSERYGIALYDDLNLSGNAVITVKYVDFDSPFSALQLQNNTQDIFILEEGMVISRITYLDYPTSLTSKGAASMVNDLDQSETVIREVMFSTVGGGIKGSLIATLYLIILTLIIAMPLGVLSAVYLSEFAPHNRVTKLLRSFVETLTGVPSIIFGLLGITVFVPITSSLTRASGANLIAGALTLSIILLPVIIRTTEESLLVVPKDHRLVSLALGANHTQTTFKVVLPQALPGLLTATFLAIGRIIGESAALIFVLGTAVRDRVSIFESATPLAVHIWSMMTDEPANVALSSTVAIIILMIVLILNLSIKTTVFLWRRKRSA